jgi:hypothetical protein
MGDSDSRAETVNGVAAAATGLGVITFGLFPLAVPITILTIVALLPLALPLVPLAALGAVFAGIWIGMRAVARAVRRPRMPRPAVITGEERLT